MRLRTIQLILWALALAASLAYGLLIWWPENQKTTAETQFTARFELTDHQGITRTQADFTGRWMLVFFGFSNCPDVCPTTLAEVAAVMDGLGPDAAEVAPLFISIDPERDTPEALAEYVPLFGAGITGLTGTTQQIEQTGQGFHIFYEKIEEAAAPGGYTMGHSSQLFLFDPSAVYAKSWQYGTPAEEILADLKEQMEQW
ncbi:SCO family protein [Halocynthiibacter styelae]|uniref:SCO family protein n=1 Tax=Halocynthiibacter styelae TaxID=2761955 RepID=UPI001E2BC168|nr:SCO family protein [Paenihalocynthiibacter styelae]